MTDFKVIKYKSICCRCPFFDDSSVFKDLKCSACERIMGCSVYFEYLYNRLVRCRRCSCLGVLYRDSKAIDCVACRQRSICKTVSFYCEREVSCYSCIAFRCFDLLEGVGLAYFEFGSFECSRLGCPVSYINYLKLCTCK